MSHVYHFESSEEDQEEDEGIKEYEELPGEGYDEAYEYVVGAAVNFYEISEDEVSETEIEAHHASESESGNSFDNEIHKSTKFHTNVESEESITKQTLKKLNDPAQSPDLIESLPDDISGTLVKFWLKMENSYASTNLRHLEEIQICHDKLVNYPSNFRSDLFSLLGTPDGRNKVTEKFMLDFNRLRPSTRSDETIKSILYLRINEFLVKLEGVTEEKYARSKAEAYKLLSKGYLTTEAEKMSTLFKGLLQAQTDRFVDTVKFINEHYYTSLVADLNVPNKVAWRDLVETDLLSKTLYCKFIQNLHKCSGREEEDENHELGGTLANKFWDDAALLKFIGGRAGEAELRTDLSHESTTSSTCICGEDQTTEDNMVCEDDKETPLVEDLGEGGLLGEGEFDEQEDMEFGLEFSRRFSKMSGEMQQSFEFDNHEFEGEGNENLWTLPHPELDEEDEELELLQRGYSPAADSRATGSMIKEKEDGDKKVTLADGEKHGGGGGGKNLKTRKSRMSASGKRRKTTKVIPPEELKPPPEKEKNRRKSMKEPSEGKVAKKEDSKRISKQSDQKEVERPGTGEHDEYFDEEDISEGVSFSSHLEFTEENEEFEMEHSSENSEMSRRKKKSIYDEYPGEDMWDATFVDKEFSDVITSRNRRNSRASSQRDRDFCLDEKDTYVREFFWDSDPSKEEVTEVSSAQSVSDPCKDVMVFDEDEYFDDEDVFYKREEFFEKDVVKPGRGSRTKYTPEPDNLHFSIFGRDESPFQTSLLQKLLVRAGPRETKMEIIPEETNSIFELPKSILFHQNAPVIEVPAIENKPNATPYPPLSTIGPPSLHISPSLTREQGFLLVSPFVEDFREKSEEDKKIDTSVWTPDIPMNSGRPTGYKRPLFDGLAIEQDEIWNVFESALKDSKRNVDKLAVAVTNSIFRGFSVEPEIPKVEPVDAAIYPLVPPRDLCDVPYAVEGFDVSIVELFDHDSKHKKHKKKGRYSKSKRGQLQKTIESKFKMIPKWDEPHNRHSIEAPPAPSVTAVTEPTDDEKPVDNALSSGSQKSGESANALSEGAGFKTSETNLGEAVGVGRKTTVLQKSLAQTDVRLTVQEIKIEGEKTAKAIGENGEEQDVEKVLPQVDAKVLLKVKLQNWKKALETEVERLKRQLTTIETRVQEEVRYFKDLPFQVWENSKLQSIEVYTDDLKRDDEVGEIFRSAIKYASQVYGKFYIDRYDLMLLLNGTEPPIPLEYPDESKLQSAKNARDSSFSQQYNFEQ